LGCIIATKSWAAFAVALSFLNFCALTVKPVSNCPVESMSSCVMKNALAYFSSSLKCQPVGIRKKAFTDSMRFHENPSGA
jgi:hypothetical protein